MKDRGQRESLQVIEGDKPTSIGNQNKHADQWQGPFLVHPDFHEQGHWHTKNQNWKHPALEKHDHRINAGMGHPRIGQQPVKTHSLPPHAHEEKRQQADPPQQPLIPRT